MAVGSRDRPLGLSIALPGTQRATAGVCLGQEPHERHGPSAHLVPTELRRRTLGSAQCARRGPGRILPGLSASAGRRFLWPRRGGPEPQRILCGSHSRRTEWSQGRWFRARDRVLGFQRHLLRHLGTRAEFECIDQCPGTHRHSDPLHGRWVYAHRILGGVLHSL